MNKFLFPIKNPSVFCSLIWSVLLLTSTNLFSADNGSNRADNPIYCEDAVVYTFSGDRLVTKWSSRGTPMACDSPEMANTLFKKVVDKKQYCQGGVIHLAFAGAIVKKRDTSGRLARCDELSQEEITEIIWGDNYPTN